MENGHPMTPLTVTDVIDVFYCAGAFLPLTSNFGDIFLHQPPLISDLDCNAVAMVLWKVP